MRHIVNRTSFEKFAFNFVPFFCFKIDVAIMTWKYKNITLCKVKESTLDAVTAWK